MMKDPRRDPMAPENLPKGMVIKPPEVKSLSQDERNYSGEILKALKSISGIEVEVVKLEVIEEKGEDPLVTVIMEVRKKG